MTSQITNLLISKTKNSLFSEPEQLKNVSIFK